MANKCLLSEIYRSKEDKILKLEKYDKEELKELLEKRKIKNKQLESAINNIPNCFKCTINNINKAIEEKLEVESNLHGYFNEKSYVSGFTDAMEFVIKLIESNNDDFKEENKAKSRRKYGFCKIRRKIKTNNNN